MLVSATVRGTIRHVRAQCCVNYKDNTSDSAALAATADLTATSSSKCLSATLSKAGERQDITNLLYLHNFIFKETLNSSAIDQSQLKSSGLD